jgi:hypothetical protein
MVFLSKFIAYVKNESCNMNTMIITLKSIVSCDTLDVKKKIKGHVLNMSFLSHVNM